MNLSDTPDVDNVNNGLMDKYLNAELIFDVDTGHEQKGCIVKRTKGPQMSPLGVHMPTRCSTPVSMWSSSRMDHPRTTSQMSLPSACMHKSILRGAGINSSAKSRTIGPVI
jgi:hypothetical protein